MNGGGGGVFLFGLVGWFGLFVCLFGLFVFYWFC